MKINIPFDYLVGHLRYGHLEGEVELDPEAEKEFKELLKKEKNNTITLKELDKLDDYTSYIREQCDIVIDDYCINDCGDLDWSVLLED